MNRHIDRHFLLALFGHQMNDTVLDVLLAKPRRIATAQPDVEIRVESMFQHVRASPVQPPPIGTDWMHEIKQDCFRMLALRDTARVRSTPATATISADAFPRS
jgi:ATP-dependent DNA ligase